MVCPAKVKDAASRNSGTHLHHLELAKSCAIIERLCSRPQHPAPQNQQYPQVDLESPLVLRNSEMHLDTKALQNSLHIL